MIRNKYHGGVLVGQWDSVTGVFTEWDLDGQIIDERPFTPSEQARMDAIIAEQQGYSDTEGARRTIVAAYQQLVTDRDASDALHTQAQAFVASPTYSKAQLDAIAQAVVGLSARQTRILTALTFLAKWLARRRN